MTCPLCHTPLAANGRCYKCGVENMRLFAEHLERKQAAEIAAAQDRIMRQEGRKP